MGTLEMLILLASGGGLEFGSDLEISPEEPRQRPRALQPKPSKESKQIGCGSSELIVPA